MLRTAVWSLCIVGFFSQGLADVTRTLAIVKPHALKHADTIKELAIEKGFKVRAFSRVGLDKEAAEQFYAEHAEKPYFKDLVESMSRGPSALMVLEGEDAVSTWRVVIGPTDPALAKAVMKDSLRAKYGESILNNAVHGSANVKAAKKELGYFFPGLAEFDGVEEDFSDLPDPSQDDEEEFEDEEGGDVEDEGFDDDEQEKLEQKQPTSDEEEDEYEDVEDDDDDPYVDPDDEEEEAAKPKT